MPLTPKFAYFKNAAKTEIESKYTETDNEDKNLHEDYEENHEDIGY